ncbi:MAG: bifunctional phosphoribosylaminoimidazolecarboxamide formyltransferase/IMP cyclohydrolase [Pirellulales bacterium]
MAESPRIQRALISVSDKTGLTEFARALVGHGVQLFASGGTYRHLQAAGLQVSEVGAYTGFPEMLDGRVKTLHPKVHGGILARHDRPDDLEALAAHGIVTFELVVVNLYPFEQTVARPGVTWDEAIEQIDIGGPSLVRGAAKNHAFVTVCTDATQYSPVLEQVAASGGTTLEFRKQLAGAAYARTAEYDRAISGYFAQQLSGHGEADAWPQCITLSLERQQVLRYGENPHQGAALYRSPQAGAGSLVRAEQLHGKELSYNNLLDLDSALNVVKSLDRPAVAVIKHNNPCGAAWAEQISRALSQAWEGDPLSAFGSVLAFNRPVDAASAEYLAEPGRFVEAIVAPDFEPAAVEILTTRPKWKENVRLLRAGELTGVGEARGFRQIDGGFLAQTPDDAADPEAEWKIVTAAQPSTAQLADLRLAWSVVRHVKSNAIVLAKDGAVCGVGAGQMSRVDAVEIALRKAGDRARRAALASDAFFPFPDSVEAAAAAGVGAFIQPGGSRRDEDAIAACNHHGLPMLFTSRRHFKH